MTAHALRVTAMTHRGAVRENNEDALVVGPLTACGVSHVDPVVCEIPFSSPVLVAVADGMGGHAAGEVASAHAVRSLASTAPQTPADLEETLKRIDRELLAMAEADTTIAGLGTTIAGVLLTAEGNLHFGVGDSRLYAGSGGYLAQISVDDRGAGGGLTNCLGGRADGSPLRVAVEPLTAADRLLLCSDGLSDLTDLETMERLLNESDDPTRAVKSLWAAAMNASGRDNITIALVEFLPQ
jgi:serine/threonine protein phosphatase PrpC